MWELKEIGQWNWKKLGNHPKYACLSFLRISFLPFHSPFSLILLLFVCVRKTISYIQFTGFEYLLYADGS